MISLLTDLHFGYKSNNEVAFENQMLFFEKQFFPYLIEQKIKDVACLGDIFDNRNTVGIYILQELRERFFYWFRDNGITFHNIIGNHDNIYNNTLSHNVFKATGIDLIKGINIYDTVQRVEIDNLIYAMVPWITDESLDIPKNVDVVLGHFEMKDFCVTKGIQSKSGFDKSEFANFKLVLSGHYHIADRQANIQYIGNPYQKDWGDFNLDKGFWTLSSKCELEHHINNVSPRHINIAYNEDEDGTFNIRTRGLGIKDITSNDLKHMDMFNVLCQSNHVKFVVESGTDQKRIDKIYATLVSESGEGFTPQLINVTDVVSYTDIQRLENDIKEDSDVIGNMKMYTESVVLNDNLDKELLMDMFQDIYKQTIIGAQ
jgi:DNA repair exonuclease SbcCD nuclease subunit